MVTMINLSLLMVAGILTATVYASESALPAKQEMQRAVEIKTLAAYQAALEKLGKEDQVITYMTYNVCNDFVVQNHPELYRIYGFKNRLPRIKKLIDQEKPDVIGFQEIRDEKDMKVMVELWKEIGTLGYEMVSFRHNPSDGAFINVIAYNPKKIACDNVWRWWVSETPNKCSDTWGNGWGRVTMMLNLRLITTKDVRSQKVIVPNYDFPSICIGNVHRGLKHAERMAAARVDVEEIEKRIDPKNSLVLLGGDFNSFPDDGGAEEIQSMKDKGYDDLSSVKTYEGIPVSGTFAGYPYDKFKSPPSTLGNHLDHAFFKQYGASSHRVAYFSYLNAKKYNENPEATETATCEADLLKPTVTDESGTIGASIEDRNFPSDHLPVIIKLIIKKCA